MRTGKFGHQPRVQPSLTATLTSIARELQNQRDSNIMDAWQKGGTFEGAKATDEKVLSYWQAKLGDVSKDDPLYDTYKNAHTQLDYNIHESKMTAAYALQNPPNDAAMVKFYTDWSKKIPKDSEFYRVLQRDAGQYMRRASAGSKAAAAKALELKYQDQQNATRKGKEAAGEYILDVFRKMAQGGNSGAGIDSLIGAQGSGSDLTNFDPKDPEQMMRLLSLIEPRADTTKRVGKSGSELRGSTDVMFHDGKTAVTGADIIAKLGKTDPTWKPGTPVDVSYVTGLLDQQSNGLAERIARATKTGHVQDAANLAKSADYVASLTRIVASIPIEKSYQDAHGKYVAIAGDPTANPPVAGDPTASPAAVTAAWKVYQATLYGLAKDPRIAADDNLKSRLTAEANETSGAPTLNESFTGLETGKFDSSSGAIAANKANLDFQQAQTDAVAGGTAVWAYGTTIHGVFTPQAGGKEIGAASPDQVKAGGMNPVATSVPDPRGGPALTIYVSALPVYATATDPVTGQRVSPSDGRPIAYAYDIPNGGTTSTTYGFQTLDANGKPQTTYSADGNWGDHLPVTGVTANGRNELNVDLSSMVFQQTGVDATGAPVYGHADLSKNGAVQGLPGFSVDGAKPATATSPGTPGTLSFVPVVAATSTSTRNALGAPDPITDFHSLTFANLLASPDGRSVLSTLDAHPEVASVITADINTYAGMQQDMKTGAWMPGPSFDASKLATANAMVANAKAAGGDTTAFIKTAGDFMQRLTTGSPFPGGAVTGPDARGQTSVSSPAAKLATDLLQGTPFAAIGNIFQPHTNNVVPPTGPDDRGLNIKLQGAIKVPGSPLGGIGNIGGTTTSTQGSVLPQGGSTSNTQTSVTPQGGTGGTGGQQGAAPPPQYGGHKQL